MAGMTLLLNKATWVNKARTLAFWILAVMVVASVGMLLAAKPAHADTIRVNSMEDAGDNNPGNGICATAPFPVGTEPKCALRAAIQEANANGVSDTIIFDSFLSGTLTLTLGELAIANDTPATDDLIIQGPEARKITVSGNDASRVFLLRADTDISIIGLTISDGAADFGGGIDLGGFATVRLTNTTVSNNTASCGGGIFNREGGVLLTNTTVSNNTATGDGGGTAARGGGIVNQIGTVRLTNTIVARNTATTNPDAEGTFTSQGNNLIGDTTGATGFVNSDLKNVDPLLGPLQDNGGPTLTHALLAGSPAVDAANNTPCPFLDQRGVTRKDGDGDGTVVCDIGSFEQQDIVAPTVKSVSPTGKKVSPRANVTATFSEVMNEASVEALGTFTLKKGTTTIPATVTYDPSTRKATLDPSRKLRSGATYVATVTPAAKDSAGNALDQDPNTTGNQPRSWRFRVR